MYSRAIKLFSKTAGVCNSITSGLENNFKIGFSKELKKIASELPVYEGTITRAKIPSFNEYLKEQASSAPSIPEIDLGIDNKSIARNLVRAATRIDREMMESGSSPIKAVAAVAAPFTQRYLIRKATGTTLKELETKIDESA
jgi:hypothetical protein